MRPDKVAPLRVACVCIPKTYTVSKAIPPPLLPYSSIPTSSQIHGPGHKACATPRNEAIMLIKDHTATFVNMLSRYVEAFQCLRLGRPVTFCGRAASSLQAYKVHAGKQRNECDHPWITCINNLASESTRTPPDWTFRQPHCIHCGVLYESSTRGMRQLFPWNR